MRWPADPAAARRDAMLGRTRQVSRWIAGGAAAASVGLGIAFAHALPGHGAAAASRPVVSSPSGQAGNSAGSAQTGQGGQSSQLQQPRQAPAPSPAPPQVVSGGS